MYGKEPKKTAVVELRSSELFMYQYLPIKLAGVPRIISDDFEPRLHFLSRLIGAACCDYVADYGIEAMTNSYVYLTAKNLYQPAGAPYNRPGWHSDGFMTDDISYIWSNSCPTIYNTSKFDLSPDDRISLNQMEVQARPANNKLCEVNTLYRMDQYVIHKVNPSVKPGVRLFVKINISKDKYNLAGNSHNYHLDYAWEMRERQPERNMPQ